ncbi:hypothetical protein GII33_18100 [Gordonia pseudamarae]|jgi:hypothetical protein|uniref:Uncharacterized protein n=1 Tax=Gordonia pseudamarae TaxID=2831662 RepID=A0ABX6IKP9_9ACTN|nr:MULTISPECIES: hypothetical protein [Gordonia]MBD0021231.1 hypothetical protein [Gordonia sp. (in: high G+C Gram-positive bacteria)]QHN27595.1 hypothetical protein GII33_18100 [Gordonia pseudamarae]QHN36477.1 hypothetical protein GII31_17875 [Gordonia pseudamarae]
MPRPSTWGQDHLVEPDPQTSLGLTTLFTYRSRLDQAVLVGVDDTIAIEI